MGTVLPSPRSSHHVHRICTLRRPCFFTVCALRVRSLFPQQSSFFAVHALHIKLHSFFECTLPSRLRASWPPNQNAPSESQYTLHFIMHLFFQKETPLPSNRSEPFTSLSKHALPSTCALPLDICPFPRHAFSRSACTFFNSSQCAFHVRVHHLQGDASLRRCALRIRVSPNHERTPFG